MSNKYWNNQTGPNHSGSGGPSPAKGSPPSGGGSTKTVSWPGLPGQTQPKDRSAGQPKKGWKGDFQIQKEGL